MAIFIVTLSVFLIAFGALSVGMIFGRAGIKGHCGNPSLDGGCADSDPQPLQEIRRDAGRKRCIVDEQGNKISPCDSCNCID